MAMATAALAAAGWAAEPAVGKCAMGVTWRNASGVAVTLDVQGKGPQKLDAGRSSRYCAPTSDVAYGVQAGAWLYAAKLQLRPGEHRTIELRAPGGTVEVLNRTEEPQAVAVDGAATVTLQAGEHRVLGPLQHGTHALVARSLRSAWVWGTTVKVRPGHTINVTLPPPRGKVRLRNPMAEAAALTIGTRPYGVVPVGGELWVVGLAAGSHAIRWTGSVLGKQVDETAVANDPDAQRSLVVQLTAINATGEDVELPVAMAAAATVLQAGTRQTWVVPRAEFRITATGRDSGLPYTFDIRKRGAAVAQWRLTRPTAIVRVHNRSGEPAVLTVHGSPVATLANGAKIVLRVPAGRLQVAAALASRPQPQRAGLMLQANQQALWVVAARETALTVHNKWPEPLELRVDGRRIGLLQANGDVRVPLAPGQHDLMVANWRLGWLERTRILLHDGENSHPTFAPPSAAAHLDNTPRKVAGELWIENGHALDVAAGATGAVAIAPGHTFLQARDAAGQRGENSEFWSAPTEQVAVPLPPHKKVRVVVVADTAKPVNVGIDDGKSRILHPGEHWPAGEFTAATHLLTIDDNGRRISSRLTLDGRKSEVRIFVRRQVSAAAAAPK